MWFPNWQVVRHLSQLSLLNRIAFTMLFAVPLICGLMRPVQSSANGYNNVLGKTRDRIVEVELLPDSVQMIVNGIKSQLSSPPPADSPTYVDLDAVPIESLDPIRAFIVRKFPWTLDIPRLPRPWGLAFVAALLILIGDTIVQCRCPLSVRKLGLDEHVHSQAERFSNSPSLSRLKEARELLRAQNPSEAEASAKPDEENSETVTEFSQQASLLADEAVFVEKLRTQQEPNRFDLENLQQIRTSIIEAASRIEYLALAKTRRIAASVSLLSYSVAGLFIIRILYEQSLNVMRSSGWSG